MSFYKTNDAAAIAAWDAEREALKVLHEEARKFGALFGATKAVVLNGFTRYHFHGIRFYGTKAPDLRLWTSPDREYKCQRPRTVVTGVKDLPKAEKDALKLELAALRARYTEAYPKVDAVQKEPLYQSLGTDWGNIGICGATIFKGVDGCIYVQTKAKLGPMMTEIMGSEWHAASEALQASKG